jgi:sec-independent protein translocase protein TatC
LQLLIAKWEQETLTPLHKQIIQHERVVNHSEEPQLFQLPPRAQVVHPENFEWHGINQVTLLPNQILNYESIQTPQLLILGPLEGISITFKICFWCSLALTSPFLVWLVFQFLLPGLRKQEKAILIPFLSWSMICMVAGLSLAYFVTIPLANYYLEAFNSPIGQNTWTLSLYIDYTLLLFFSHVVVFEMGFLLLCLVWFEIIPFQILQKKRRYAIVVAFILSAILTPPDILTQCMLAIPLIGLYELAIHCGKWRWRLKKFSK